MSSPEQSAANGVKNAEREAAERTEILANPDLSVMRLNRRKPPDFPLNVLGEPWKGWVTDAALSAAAPPDYVVAVLLPAASALIGNARWAKVNDWAEPPHLWFAAVGVSGSSKSPAGDALLRHVLPELERRMAADFPKQLREYKAEVEARKTRRTKWEAEVKKAAISNQDLPLLPADCDDLPEPKSLRLRQSDVTHEKLAELLSGACPKGILMVRDELAGWLLGMSAYSDAARPFWLEAYGGRPYRVDRVKLQTHIDIPHLVVAWAGGIQPDKLNEVMSGADDGLLARISWIWPEPVPFRIAKTTMNTNWAIECLDRLRLLEMTAADGDKPRGPIMLPMAASAIPILEKFGQEMQTRQENTSGLMTSAFGKARGLVLRLSLVLEFLWWCAGPAHLTPPLEISETALISAARLVDSYMLPMAERVYGDAACPKNERNAATLARWIAKQRPAEINARDLQRNARLPGLRNADAIHGAAQELVDAGWLIPPLPGDFQRKPKATYTVNPVLLERLP